MGLWQGSQCVLSYTAVEEGTRRLSEMHVGSESFNGWHGIWRGMCGAGFCLGVFQEGGVEG